jgi:putative DNA primase/helicase
LSAGGEAKSDHPYLVLKQIAPVPGLREILAGDAAGILGYMPKSDGKPLTGRILIVPVQIGGELSTVELIDSNGDKTALKGRGTKSGGYWTAQRLPDGDGAGATLLIGEGVATVLSASEASGQLGIAALSNTNLATVAGSLRSRYPSATLVVLADLMKGTSEPDPLADKAARVCAGRVAIPEFGAGRRPDDKDFNDMAILMGGEAVARAIADAREPERASEDSKAAESPSEPSQPIVELVLASSIHPEPVDWVWNGYIAAGKLVVLGGAPGTGKTMIAISFAAVVSRGGRWPDGTQAKAGRVIIWSGEDDPKDTLVPRLMVEGADLSRVQFVQGVRQGDERRSFDPSHDIEALRRALVASSDVRLLVVDPLVSAVSGDSHKNAEVRRSLQPLVDLASEMGCALLGITHFSKGTAGREPLERLTGSLAFGALARIVMVTAKPGEDDQGEQPPRVLIRAKSNIGRDGGGFEYLLPDREVPGHPGISSPVVEWQRAVDGTARKLLAAAEAAAEVGQVCELNEAEQFLRDALADGAMPAGKIDSDSKSAGISRATLRRAKKALGIKARKDGMKGGWVWEFPRRGSTEAEGAQPEEVSPFEDIEPLRNGGAFVEVEL